MSDIKLFRFESGCAPRLLCIAGDFTRYDQHAVKQIARNIELIRYRRFDEELLMLELVHAPKQARVIAPATPTASATQSAGGPVAIDTSDAYYNSTMAYRLAQSGSDLRDLHDSVRDFLVGLGDDVQVKELKFYTAFKRIKNFVCLEVYPKAKVVFAFLRLDPETVSLEEGFSRDMTNVGHFGSGDIQLAIRSMADFEKAQPLIRRAYEGS